MTVTRYTLARNHCACARVHAPVGEHTCMHSHKRQRISDCVHVLEHVSALCCKMHKPVWVYICACVHRPHRMSLMLTWLWRPGPEGTKGHGILRPHPTPAPFFPLSGPDTNKRIRSPCFRQTLHSRQSSDQLSVTLNDKSANLCQSLWGGIPAFGV